MLGILGKRFTCWAVVTCYWGGETGDWRLETGDWGVFRVRRCGRQGNGELMGFVKIGMLEWRGGISRCATIISSDRISKQYSQQSHLALIAGDYPGSSSFVFVRLLYL